VITIEKTLYRKVLLDDSECADLLMLIDTEIVRTRCNLANTDDSVLRKVYMRKLKNYGAVADRIRYANKERVET
jgi:hypothetical protein